MSSPEASLPPLAPLDRERLERFAALVVAEVGEALVGAYLFGSATLGGLRPESDLDLLAVVADPLADDVRLRLLERVSALSREPLPDGGRRRLELTVVVQRDVRPWRYPPRRELLYGDWLRGDLERGDLVAFAPTDDPDLTVLLAMAFRRGVTLRGRPVAEALDPVPHADVLRAMEDAAPALLADLEPDTRNVVLTLLRMWATAATGEILSKDAAAAWALDRLPAEDRVVAERAREGYLAGGERWDDLAAHLRPFAARVLEEIRAAQEPPRASTSS